MATGPSHPPLIWEPPASFCTSMQHGRRCRSKPRAQAFPPACARRPVVRGADDTSNFEDYSELGDMEHEFNLSQAEQAHFTGF